LCASCSSVASRRANQLGVNHILVRMNGVCRRWRADALSPCMALEAMAAPVARPTPSAAAAF
jgi:hypothetical protein